LAVCALSAMLLGKARGVVSTVEVRASSADADIVEQSAATQNIGKIPYRNEIPVRIFYFSKWQRHYPGS